MTTAMITLWSRTMAIAAGTPEIVARRVAGLMNPAAAWSPAGARECQSMLLEKIEAGVEASWALGRGALSFGRMPAWGPSPWWPALQTQSLTSQVVAATDQVIRPVSDRVTANVERLRSG